MQARLAGADLVINYRTEDVVAKAMAFTGKRGVDRVVDVDFGGNIATTLKIMALNSTIAVYATNGNRTPAVPMRELMEKCIALRTLVLFALPPPLLAAAQADISKWLAAGNAHPQHRRAIRAVGNRAGAPCGGEGRQARHRHRRLRALDRACRGPLIAPGHPELVESFGQEVAEHRLAQEIARPCGRCVPSAASRRKSFHSSSVPSPRPSRIKATRSTCSSSVRALMKPADLAHLRDRVPLSSSTSIMSSSAPFEPESGSEAASLTSNSRAFSIKNRTFSAEIS